MMRTAIRAHWARIRVLFTILVALSILFVVFYLLSGGGLFRARVTLRTYFEDAGALEPDSEVDFNGVKIGKVSSVALSHLNDARKTVEVRLRVERRFLSQIPKDSKSEIQTRNILGDKFIEITRGKSPVQVEDGGELEHVPATNVYVTMDLTTFSAQLRSVDTVLKDIQEGKGSLGQFVMTDKIYQDLLTGLTKVQRDVDAAVSTKTTVGQLLYSPKMYEQLKGYIRSLDAGLAALQAGQGPTGKLLRNPELYDNAHSSLADFRRSAKKAGESGFVASDELYKDWNRQLAAFVRAIDDFNAGKGSGQMVASSQTYESLAGSMSELESTMKDFRTNPRKYLRLKIF